jgi:hypothetical protein
LKNEIYLSQTGGAIEWDVTESDFHIDHEYPTPIGYLTVSQPYIEVTDLGEDPGHTMEVDIYPTLEEAKKLRAALDLMIAGAEG